MTRQEKYDRLIELLSSVENFEKRPKATWTNEEIYIFNQREKLKEYLKIIDTTSGDKKTIAEQNFDIIYAKLWSKLDELGWK